jgi:hypothetical protein
MDTETAQTFARLLDVAQTIDYPITVEKVLRSLKALVNEEEERRKKAEWLSDEKLDSLLLAAETADGLVTDQMLRSVLHGVMSAAQRMDQAASKDESSPFPQPPENAARAKVQINALISHFGVPNKSQSSIPQERRLAFLAAVAAIR